MIWGSFGPFSTPYMLGILKSRDICPISTLYMLESLRSRCHSPFSTLCMLESLRSRCHSPFSTLCMLEFLKSRDTSPISTLYMLGDPLNLGVIVLGQPFHLFPNFHLISYFYLNIFDFSPHLINFHLAFFF